MSNNDNVVKRILDFVIIISMVSAPAVWGLIRYGVISETNAKFIFLPGYIMMLILLCMVRLALIDIHDGGNKNDR